MSRITMALVAACAAAMVATAVVALPALAGGGSGTDNPDPFVACLRTHGLADAPSDPLALKAWLGSRERSDAQAVQSAIAACKAQMRAGEGAPGPPGPDIGQMIACVRGKGLDAPTDPDQFKSWVADQEAGANRDAVDKIIVACKAALDPAASSGDPAKPGCGGGDATPADKPSGDANAT